MPPSLADRTLAFLLRFNADHLCTGAARHASAINRFLLIQQALNEARGPQAVPASPTSPPPTLAGENTAAAAQAQRHLISRAVQTSPVGVQPNPQDVVDVSSESDDEHQNVVVVSSESEDERQDGANVDSDYEELDGSVSAPVTTFTVQDNNPFSSTQQLSGLGSSLEAPAPSQPRNFIRSPTSSPPPMPGAFPATPYAAQPSTPPRNRNNSIAYEAQIVWSSPIKSEDDDDDFL
jgi:hypothetical protein